MPEETKDTAKFSFVVNDLFDLFNVSRPVMDDRCTRKGFGLDIDKQIEVLNISYDYIMSLRHPNKEALIPFQRGLLQDINALRMLHQHISKKYSVPYILTERLNQDCLERLFGLLRAKGGGLNDHPTPVQLHYRLKKCIMGRAIESQRLKSFCSNIQDEQEEYRWPSVIPTGELGRSIMHSMGKELQAPLPEVKQQTMEYMAGYLCHSKGQRQPHLAGRSEECHSFTQHVNQGGLILRPIELVKETEELYGIFERADFYAPKLMERLISKSHSISGLSDKKKKLFNTCIFNKINN